MQKAGESMNAADFGKIISKLRKKQGMTQSELAKLLNVTDRAVSKWENGGGFPEITQLPTLSKIFGVSTDYLLKANSSGIAVAGNIIVDIINIIDKYPKKTMQSNVLKAENAVGGCVCNTIIDLSKIDSNILLTAIGKVGNDDTGKFVLSEMQKLGIDISQVKVSDTLPTSCSYVMSEEKSGDRTFFYVKGANGEFGIEDIDLDSLNCKIFHIGYILLLDMLDAPDNEYGTKMARLLHDISERGIKTSIDVVSSESDKFSEKIIPSLKYTDYVILNEIESCRVTGLSPRKSNGSIQMENINKTMEAFIEYGVREKVIIYSSEAGFMLTKDNEFTIVPSPSLPDGYIKGSVGAGDAYAAGCLYGIYNGYDGKELLEFASGAAACSLSQSDSVSGMKSKSEIEELIKLYPKQDLKI